MPSLNEIARYENPLGMDGTWHIHQTHGYGQILNVGLNGHDFRPNGSSDTFPIGNDEDVYES